MNGEGVAPTSLSCGQVSVQCWSLCPLWSLAHSLLSSVQLVGEKNCRPLGG
jgi:hypothetical protein